MVIILWISLEKGECFHFNHSLGCVYHTLYIIRLLGWVYHLRWLICYPCSLTHVIIYFFLIYCGTKHSDILQGTSHLHYYLFSCKFYNMEISFLSANFSLKYFEYWTLKSFLLGQIFDTKFQIIFPFLFQVSQKSIITLEGSHFFIKHFRYFFVDTLVKVNLIKS